MSQTPSEKKFEITIRTWRIAFYVGSVITLSFAANAAFNGIVSNLTYVDALMSYILPAVWGVLAGTWMVSDGGRLDHFINSVETEINYIALTLSTHEKALKDNIDQHGTVDFKKIVKQAVLTRKEAESGVWRDAEERFKRDKNGSRHIHSLVVGLSLIHI